MGLIKALAGSVGGVFADQWKEYFYCESMESNLLITKGMKKTSKRSSNKKGDDNVISDGSIIAVNEGQCMIIVDGGKVVDVCAEPGEYTYNSKTSPSLFTGSLGESIKNTFKNSFSVCETDEQRERKRLNIIILIQALLIALLIILIIVT